MCEAAGSDHDAHDESDNLLASAILPRASVIHRLNLGDWVVTLFLLAFGFWADQAEPVLRQILPQAHDPAISYKHTPNAHARVPTVVLFRLAYWLPLAVLVVIVLLCPVTKAAPANRPVQLNEAILGLTSSFSTTLLTVSLIKNQVGRLRPDFLDRCKLVDGICTGNPVDIMEGRAHA